MKQNMIQSGSCGVAAFLSIHFLPALMPLSFPDFIFFPILFLTPLIWLWYLLRKRPDFPPRWIWFGLLVHYLIQYVFRGGLPIGWWWANKGNDFSVFDDLYILYNMTVFPLIATAIQYSFLKIAAWSSAMRRKKK